MKFLRLSILVMFFCFLSCASSEKVIMDSGKVYKVKGSSFFRKGKDVTDELSSAEKEEIRETLDQRLEFEQKAEERKEELEEIQKKAAKEQKEIEKKLAEQQAARDTFFKAKEKLREHKEEYQDLLNNGKLSPKKEARWKKRLARLEEKVQEAENNLKRN